MSAGRRTALRALLRSRDVDALLVTDLVNVRYLTDFTGSNAALLVHVDGDGRSRLCTDGRYRAQVAAEVPDLEAVIERACAVTLAGLAPGLGVGALGFESDHVTVDAHAALAEHKAALVRAPGLVQRLRMVKDDAELAVLRTACAIADAALAELIDHGGLAPGRTEAEVALDLEYRMRAHGAAGPSFDTIVAAGERTALPHARPTDQRLQGNELVLIDMGALRHGYASDMTRTLYLGRPSPKVRRMYGAVLQAQLAGIAAIRPGATAEQVDRACRKVLKSHGLDKYFTHSTGHGLGLEIHEAPRLGKGDTTRLEAGMAITVEPGVYVEGFGGIRIEDTVAVTANGCEVLTPTPKEFLTI